MKGKQKIMGLTTLMAAVVLVQIKFSNGAWMTNVCTNSSVPPGQPPKPQVPNQWRAKVECSIMAQNKTVFVEEYYDYNANKARARQYDFLEKGDLYYDFQNNEILQLDRLAGGGTCQVLDLDHNPNNFLFGVTSSMGHEHVLTPAGALHFGDDYNWVYNGEHKDVRGIVAESWSTCQYWPDMDATMTVVWYFSVNTEWDMQIGSGTVPLRAVVTGKVNDPQKGIRDFNNTYEIFDFEPSVRATDFQLQPGDYCPGRATTKPFPTLPNIFSMIGEQLDNDQNLMKTVEEYYDNSRQLNVYKYKDFDALTLLVGAAQRTEVNDFNEGYAYMLDTKADSCRVGLIEDGNFAYVDAGAQTVKQQTPAQFFLSNNVTWEYGGVKNMRGMDCDTWIGVTSNMRGYPGQTVRIEWAFAVSGYNDWNTGISTVPIPVSARIWRTGASGSDQVNYQFNAYAFTQYSQPFYSTIDISSCFRGAERVNAGFEIDNRYQSSVINNPQGFRLALADALQNTLGISPLRVADIMMDKAATGIAVSFNLLDKPSFAGDTNGIQQNSLSAAVSLLIDPIVYQSFQIDVVDGVNVVNIQPMNNTGRLLFSNGTCLGYCPNNPQSGSSVGTTGYSGGALGGLGFAMLLVGGAFGGGGGYFFTVRK